LTKPVTYSAAFQQGLREEMSLDKSIFVLGTDLYDRGGHFAQVAGIGKEFGKSRVRDSPISEAAMVAAGVGAAMSGARPVIDLNFADFAFGAFDEIANQAAKIRYMWGRKVPMVIRATSGVAFGGTQHNNSLEMLFASIPGIAVVTPSTPRDVKGMIKTALRAEDPVVFLMHKKLTGVRGEVGDESEFVPFGKAARLREGNDVTLVSYSHGVITTLEAADALASDGIGADVIDLRSVFPLDIETVLASVRRTGKLVVVDEAPAFGALAGQIAAAVQSEAFWYLDGPIAVVTSPQTPIPHSPPMIDALLPSVADVVAAATRLVH
jgi:pyruvate/2-oxoglutarate/acetoin dehydrogenase E1 component